MIEVFSEDPEKVKTLFEIMVKQKLLATRQDKYKNVVFSVVNKAVLNNLATFILAYLKGNPQRPCLSVAALGMLRVLERMAMAAPYDNITVSVGDLIKEGKRDGMNTEGWDKEVATLATAGEEVKVVKTSSGPGLKTSKKDVSQYVRHHELLAAFYKANLG